MEVKVDLTKLTDELRSEYLNGYKDGIEEGISKVMKWLESEKDLETWIEENAYTSFYNLSDERLHWNRIKNAIGKKQKEEK